VGLFWQGIVRAFDLVFSFEKCHASPLYSRSLCGSPCARKLDRAVSRFQKDIARRTGLDVSRAGFLDDGGGTQIKVTFEGKTQTLHALWDTGILATEHRERWQSYLTKRLAQMTAQHGGYARAVGQRVASTDDRIRLPHTRITRDKRCLCGACPSHSSQASGASRCPVGVVAE
jgi:hypothetical protein